MKKTLLTLAIMLLGFSAAKAEEVFNLPDLYKYTDKVTEEQITNLPGSGSNSINFKTDGITLTSGDISIAFSSGTNTNNGPIYYNTNGTRTLRVYKNNTFTVSSTSEDLTKIEFKNGNSNFTVSNSTANKNTTANVGTLSGTGQNITWEAGAVGVKSVTFTVGSGASTVQLSVITVNPVVKETEKVADIAAFIAKADNLNPVIITGNVTVYYVNGKSMYISDGSGRMCVYNSSASWTYKAGDVIPGGFQGTYELRNGMAQMTSPTNFAAATETVTPEAPKEVSVSEITAADVYDYVILKDVTVAATTTNRNYDITEGQNTIKGYDNFYISIPESFDGKFNVTGIVGLYSNNPQILLTSFEALTPTGIADIVADENAPVEYFNLQGIRVDNPENGLYIRRQGNKVTKVIVK